MPDLLILSPSDNTNLHLQLLGEREGFRVRATSQYRHGLEWLKIRRFDVAFVDNTIPIAAQQEMAGLLWGKNNSALMYVFDLTLESSNREPEQRLFGAEVVSGENAPSQLAAALRQFLKTEASVEEPFDIMVVEDLDSPRDIICIFLEGIEKKNRVVGFRDGEEALAELKFNPKRYSCVVTDLKMPKMDGDALTKAIRNDPALAHLPVIVLTAFGTTDALVNCLRAGASGFLVKPPKKEAMLKELGRAKRIATRKLEPRLVAEGDVDRLLQVIEEKGLI